MKKSEERYFNTLVCYGSYPYNSEFIYFKRPGEPRIDKNSPARGRMTFNKARLLAKDGSMAMKFTITKDEPAFESFKTITAVQMPQRIAKLLYLKAFPEYVK